MRTLCQFFLVLVTAYFFPLPVSALEIDRSLVGDYKTALVIHDRSTQKTFELDPSLSDLPLPPCSTFKIINTLIGLDLGFLPAPDKPWYTWDGVERNLPDWNQDLALRDAFRVSAVPAFQELARTIGPERMQDYLAGMNYGDQDISAGIDVFWLGRPGSKSILISANDQVRVLKQILDGTSPFKKESLATLKDVMFISETPRGKLYGKTGSAMNAKEEWVLGWFIGFLETKETTLLFALHIQGGENPNGRTARAIVENIFKTNGLL